MEALADVIWRIVVLFMVIGGIGLIVIGVVFVRVMLQGYREDKQAKQVFELSRAERDEAFRRMKNGREMK